MVTVPFCQPLQYAALKKASHPFFKRNIFAASGEFPECFGCFILVTWRDFVPPCSHMPPLLEFTSTDDAFFSTSVWLLSQAYFFLVFFDGATVLPYFSVKFCWWHFQKNTFYFPSPPLLYSPLLCFPFLVLFTGLAHGTKWRCVCVCFTLRKCVFVSALVCLSLSASLWCITLISIMTSSLWDP